MYNILCTTSTFSNAEKLDGFNIVFNPYKRKLKKEELLSLLKEVNPVGVIAGVEDWGIDAFDSASSLVVLSRCGVGLDSVDLEAARLKNVVIKNTPIAPVESVAELTFIDALALCRKLAVSTKSIQEKQWVKGKPGELIKGKTVGIIGCGRIGTRVAELFNGVGCTVLGYDPYLKEHAICKLVDFESLLKDSDIISLHLTVSEETKHIINEKSLSLMKPSAFIVNTARGALIDEDALVKALENDKIGGAALDVYGEEPYQGELCNSNKNVILTPHIASSTREGREVMEKEAWNNMVAVLKEKGFINE